MNKRTLIAVLVCLLCACLFCVSGCSLEQTVCDDNKSMSYEIPDIELSVGQSCKIPTFVAANGKNATYVLSKEGVVEVKNGTLYAVADGTVTVKTRIDCNEQEITVVVRDVYYALNLVNDDSKGTVTCSQAQYRPNTNATLTFTPTVEWAAESVTVGRNTYMVENNQVTFPVNDNYTVTVNYVARTYNLTVDNSTGATLTGIEAGTYSPQDFTGTLTAPTAYDIPVVYLNDEPIHLAAPQDEEQKTYNISFTLDKNITLKVELVNMNNRPTASENIQKVVDYANHMVSDYFLFTEPKSIVAEDLTNGSSGLNYTADRALRTDIVYRGMPYSHGRTTLEAFKSGASTLTSNKGSVTQIDTSNYLDRWYMVYGISCSNVVLYAWSQISGELLITAASQMTPENGCWKVGKYKSTVENGLYVDTKADCDENTEGTMYNAYSLLRPGDACTNGGHAILVTGVDVTNQKITYVESWGSAADTHETITIGGKSYPVYSGCSQDAELEFSALFERGYLPVTCKQLLTPKEVVTTQVTCTRDYPQTGEYGNLLDGYVVSANTPISHVTVTITDTNGHTETATRLWNRSNTQIPLYAHASVYDLEWTTDETNKMLYPIYTADNTIDFSQLAAGTCDCTVNVFLTNGEQESFSLTLRQY